MTQQFYLWDKSPLSGDLLFLMLFSTNLVGQTNVSFILKVSVQKILLMSGGSSVSKFFLSYMQEVI